VEADQPQDQEQEVILHSSELNQQVEQVEQIILVEQETQVDQVVEAVVEALAQAVLVIHLQ